MHNALGSTLLHSYSVLKSTQNSELVGLESMMHDAMTHELHE